ncbi:ArsR/SmtB family transcription factor [Arthrobacter sp. NPDC093139]|uniref:ArsR/SmtB family transcription factor n=1 Tax=Arthrobacter sp. NPDC093139 TaxID=3363945 RepID=UPI003808BE6C
MIDFVQAPFRHPIEPDRHRLEAAADTLRLLAEPTRLHLLWVLAAGPACVADLVNATGSARTIVSQHLAKLRLSGLVDARKEGRKVIYSIRDDHLNRLIQEAINHANHPISRQPKHD